MPASAFDRFRALRAVMEAARPWYRSRHIEDRLAAVLAIRDGPALEAVSDMNAAGAALRQGLSPFSPLRADLVRRFAAALLAARRRDARAFLSAYHTSRQRLRDAGLPRGGHGEAFAILLHFLGSNGQAMGAMEARAFREAYRALKAEKWWIAGPAHYPVLAAGLRGDARGHVARALAVYAAMRAQRLSGGPLRLAAALSLASAGMEAKAAAARYRALHDAFGTQGLPRGGSLYGALAALCHLEGEPRDLARAVAGLTADLRAERPRVSRPEGLAVLLLLGERAGALGAVGEALAMIAAEQAAMTAAIAASTAAAASSGG